MAKPLSLTPIGQVHSARTAPIDDDWGGIVARIVLDSDRFGPEALAGLDGFSHVHVIFLFHLVRAEKIETGARHPRGNRAWPRVGIFAQRGRNRPNRLGLTTCRIVAVLGTELAVAGLDAIDGTPVLDLKPAMSGFDRPDPLAEPDWAREIMADYWREGG
ncbi:MAG TPA: tRNA (N6-threonylcarbamoyladenosine(37)-N6)-methyltransferase TrmO [Rhodobacteraceae bacterium]|jgi:tRNA (Thr-GGU) A37 N-methylase|nr:SAM-dependent methyltransferase [Paracoccaceae bacterium]HBG98063.1 tRNA (N6-threonylcarbamoyladenosine(37)-N6)-methyltransferase TrmO [Paracoccaceae bacterium]